MINTQIRKWSKKVGFVVLQSFLLILILTSCQGENKSRNDTEKKPQSSSTSEIGPRTQAILMTQSFDLDVENQSAVTGDYIDKTNVTVPQNLSAQNKWMMFEGPVLENDLVAYRFYGDSRHRVDIYGKKVSDLVMDTVSWDYHDLMDWGSDILKVGNSLGLGSPAILYQDSLYTLSDCKVKTISVLESGGNKSIIRTTFTKLSIDGRTFDIVQDWSIEAGKPWSEIHLKVIGDKLPKTMSFATGIVKHLPEIIQGETGDYFYAMNWGTQSFHDQQLGMAILADKKYEPRPIDDKLSHAYAFKPGIKEVKYRFLSAWEKDNNGVKDANGFKKLVESSGE